MSENLKRWKAEFGNDYAKRNIPTPELIEARMNFWHELFDKVIGRIPDTIAEIGAGNGQNLMAMSNVFSYTAQKKNLPVKVAVFANEPNDQARNYLQENCPFVNPSKTDATNLPWEDNSKELVFTSGVLIHIPPADLDKVISEMYRVSSKYIMVMEYFAPQCEEIKYRDQDGMMWRNDFGGLLLDKYKLHVVGYGFCWKRISKLDNVTWWLMEKVH